LDWSSTGGIHTNAIGEWFTSPAVTRPGVFIQHFEAVTGVSMRNVLLTKDRLGVASLRCRCCRAVMQLDLTRSLPPQMRPFLDKHDVADHGPDAAP